MIFFHVVNDTSGHVRNVEKSGALCAPRGIVSYDFISFRAVSNDHAARLLRAIAEKDEVWRKKPILGCIIQIPSVGKK